jgi:hypothetical protein
MTEPKEIENPVVEFDMASPTGYAICIRHLSAWVTADAGLSATIIAEPNCNACGGRGPYSSIASVTLMIAMHLKNDITQRGMPIISCLNNVSPCPFPPRLPACSPKLIGTADDVDFSWFVHLPSPEKTRPVGAACRTGFS